jgi:ribokinase
MGARVDLIGCIGDDAHGRDLRKALRADGVGLRGVRRVAEPTGVAVILVERGGQNVIAVASGANACLTPLDVQRAEARIARADTVIAQLEVPLETVAAAATTARRAGRMFVLNAAPARGDLDDLLPLVDVLIVNETELAILGGGDTVGPADEAGAARELLGRGPRAAVVTLGPRRAVLVDSHGTRVVPAFAVQAVDATAAGDAFVGALAARLGGLDTLDEAARYASAAGALTCTRAGAQPSLPTGSEVDRLVA